MHLSSEGFSASKQKSAKLENEKYIKTHSDPKFFCYILLLNDIKIIQHFLSRITYLCNSEQNKTKEINTMSTETMVIWQWGWLLQIVCISLLFPKEILLVSINYGLNSIQWSLFKIYKPWQKHIIVFPLKGSSTDKVCCPCLRMLPCHFQMVFLSLCFHDCPLNSET